MSTRDELRRMWSKLDEARRTSTNSSEKASINRQMRIINRKLSTGMFVDKAIESVHVDVQIPIFEQESCFRGPTAYGNTIGEGCYWRKSGHH